MEKAVQTPPSFEEDGSFSCTKKLILEGSPASEDTEYSPFIVRFLYRFHVFFYDNDECVLVYTLFVYIRYII